MGIKDLLKDKDETWADYREDLPGIVLLGGCLVLLLVGAIVAF